MRGKKVPRTVCEYEKAERMPRYFATDERMPRYVATDDKDSGIGMNEETMPHYASGADNKDSGSNINDLTNSEIIHKDSGSGIKAEVSEMNVISSSPTVDKWSAGMVCFSIGIMTACIFHFQFVTLMLGMIIGGIARPLTWLCRSHVESEVLSGAIIHRPDAPKSKHLNNLVKGKSKNNELSLSDKSIMNDKESEHRFDLVDIRWNEGESIEDETYSEDSEDSDLGEVIMIDLDLPERQEKDEQEEETEEDEMNDEEDDGYLGLTQILKVPGEHFRQAQIKPQRKFVRLAMREDKEGMYFAQLLGVSVSYAPGTIATPPLPDGEIILGVSQNPTDMPTLLSGQRLISPVLAGMPHGTSFSRSITLQMPLLGSTPDTDSVIKVLHSSTDVSEPTDWREVDDADCLVHNGRITLSISHFCLYCVIEEKVQATQKPRPMAIFLYLRRKQLRDEAACSMEVTVQLSGKPTDDIPPPLGGKLVIHKIFTLINTRPLTISLLLRNTGWQLTNGENEQVLYDSDLAVTDVFPASCTFQVSSTPDYTGTLHFLVKLSQCQGRKTELQIIESVDELFPQMAGQPRPLVQVMQAGFSHGQLGTCSNVEPAAASGNNVYQVAPVMIAPAARYPLHQPILDFGSSEEELPSASAFPPVRKCSLLDEMNLSESSGACAISGARGLGQKLTASLAQPFSSTYGPAAGDFNQPHENSIRAESADGTADNLFYTVRAMLPKPGPTTQEWLVPYATCQAIGRNLDFCNNWKTLAEKLHCEDISQQIEEQRPRPLQEGWSPTMVLLGKWLLEQLESGKSREECLQKIRAALMGMGRNDIVELLPPAL